MFGDGWNITIGWDMDRSIRAATSPSPSRTMRTSPRWCDTLSAICCGPTSSRGQRTGDGPALASRCTRRPRRCRAFPSAAGRSDGVAIGSNGSTSRRPTRRWVRFSTRSGIIVRTVCPHGPPGSRDSWDSARCGRAAGRASRTQKNWTVPSGVPDCVEIMLTKHENRLWLMGVPLCLAISLALSALCRQALWVESRQMRIGVSKTITTTNATVGRRSSTQKMMESSMLWQPLRRFPKRRGCNR